MRVPEHACALQLGYVSDVGVCVEPASGIVQVNLAQPIQVRIVGAAQVQKPVTSLGIKNLSRKGCVPKKPRQSQRTQCLSILQSRPPVLVSVERTVHLLFGRKGCPPTKW